MSRLGVVRYGPCTRKPKLVGKMVEVVELRYGRAYLAELRASDSAKIEAEAIERFEEVAEKYGEDKYGSKTLGDYAKSAIYEIQHLSVGRPRRK